MAVNINLKEIFVTDDQSDLAEKLNFNFNQLIALGVGAKGDTGAKGEAGGPGPRGKTGETGANGSLIWSTDGTVYIDLTTASPSESGIGDYYVGRVVVGAVTYNGIYKKESEGTVWTVVTDFSEVFKEALDVTGGELFPWRVGINNQTPPARIINPINNSQGLDRKTISQLSQPADYYETYTPNWQLNTATVQNSQAVIFNFDVNTVKRIITSGAPDANGYMIKVSDDRLGANVSLLNQAFPYTSMLSLYSFYTAAEAATLADHLADTTGYRHQLELGSVDDITEYLHSNNVNDKYVISPTYQNLRIRKYRLSASDLPGKSVILTDFVLHSTDSTIDPALSSKFEWSINKKTSSAYDKNTIIRMALSSSTLEGSSANVGLTGLSVDGIHMSLEHPSMTYLFALGFDPSNYANATKNMIARSNASIDNIVLDQVSLSVKNIAQTVKFDSIGVTAGENTDLKLYASDIDQEVKIGANDSNIALTIKGSRLSGAIPFAISSGATPPHSSSDANTLDEYQEGTFTPSVYYGTLPIPAASVLTNNIPTISNENGVYIKIGKIVSFTMQFTISNWTIVTTTNRAGIGPHYSDPYATTETLVGVLNSTDGDWTTRQHELGNEAYPVIIRNIPDHWPIPTNSENVIFNVSVKPKIYNGYGLRPFAMNYQWENTGTQTSENSWLPLVPTTAIARFSKYEDGITKPQLELRGYRKNSIDSGISCTFESLISIYDFLHYVHPSDPINGNTMHVTISGVYESNHQTANNAYPIGVTTTTSTSSTTTTTTDPLATTTTSTTSTSTTTTSTSTTSTTTSSGYGPELMLNSGAVGLNDWQSTWVPGLADYWADGPYFEVYSIITDLYGFTGNAQQVVRQSTKTGGIAIRSNELNIPASYDTYTVTLKYRASHSLGIYFVPNTSVASYVDIGFAPAVTGLTYGTASFEFNTAGQALDALLFYVKSDGGSGPSIWFQIDEVSLKRKL